MDLTMLVCFLRRLLLYHDAYTGVYSLLYVERGQSRHRTVRGTEAPQNVAECKQGGKQRRELGGGRPVPCKIPIR